MITNYLANKILDHLAGRGAAVSIGASIYVGLSTDAGFPLPDGTGDVEPVGNGYARVLLGAYGQESSYKMAQAVAGANTNDDIIFFPESTGAWGICTHFLIFDALINGNLLAYGTLTAPITPILGNVPIVRVGDLDITLS